MKQIYRFIILTAIAMVAVALVAPLAASATPASQPSSGCTQLYVVRSGDTLFGIAQRYGTTVRVLQNLNGIANSSRIYTGQRLCVSTATSTPRPGTSVYATVTAGALNVRQGPGTPYPVITRAGRGGALVVLGQNTTGNWLNVRLSDGTVGWVARTYTDFRGTAAVVTAPPLNLTPAVGTVPSAGAWYGEYYNNPNLAGAPARTRNDTSVNFNWGFNAPTTGVTSDGFSVRWTRTLGFEEGRYRFNMIVDDGARLYVDGDLVINEWRDGSRRQVSAERKLSGGNHSLRVEYYERGGEAIIQLWWERLPEPPKPVTFNEWKAEYFSNRNLSGAPMFAVNNEAVNFQWGEWYPMVGMPGDNFSVRWTRTLTFEPGGYRFYAKADDGIRVYVDGQLVLDKWNDSSGYDVYSVDLRLTGQHQLKVEYYENAGVALAHFWWKKIDPPWSDPEWKVEYFSNRELSGKPMYTAVDQGLNYHWGERSPVVGMPVDNFSARWTRAVTFEPGIYRFYVQADDGVRLYVDGKLVIDEWHDSSADKVYSANLTLNGSHQLMVEYYDNAGVAMVKLWWLLVQ